MPGLDESDLRILAELTTNARASFVDIGKKLNLHPNVVAYRVNKLRQVGIIKGYTLDLDFEKLEPLLCLYKLRLITLLLFRL